MEQAQIFFFNVTTEKKTHTKSKEKKKTQKDNQPTKKQTNERKIPYVQSCILLNCKLKGWKIIMNF